MAGTWLHWYRDFEIVDKLHPADCTSLMENFKMSKIIFYSWIVVHYKIKGREDQRKKIEYEYKYR